MVEWTTSRGTNEGGTRVGREQKGTRIEGREEKDEKRRRRKGEERVEMSNEAVSIITQKNTESKPKMAEKWKKII